MKDEARGPVEDYVITLKSIVPAREHAALESRVDELMNDASASDEDVIEILREEFDPE